jgi:hypothetical protein
MLPALRGKPDLASSELGERTVVSETAARSRLLSDTSQLRQLMPSGRKLLAVDTRAGGRRRRRTGEVKKGEEGMRGSSRSGAASLGGGALREIARGRFYVKTRRISNFLFFTLE